MKRGRSRLAQEEEELATVLTEEQLIAEEAERRALTPAQRTKRAKALMEERVSQIPLIQDTTALQAASLAETDAVLAELFTQQVITPDVYQRYQAASRYFQGLANDYVQCVYQSQQLSQALDECKVLLMQTTSALQTILPPTQPEPELGGLVMMMPDE